MREEPTFRHMILVDIRGQLAQQYLRAWQLGPGGPVSVDPVGGRIGVSLDESNDVDCDGPLPCWPLPIPADWRPLVSFEGDNGLSLLCRASLLGGDSSVLFSQGDCQRH